MKIEIGKIKEQFITLPKFMFVLTKNKYNENVFFWFHIGRLYRGYIGYMGWIGKIHFDLWIYYPDAELRANK